MSPQSVGGASLPKGSLASSRCTKGAQTQLGHQPIAREEEEEDQRKWCKEITHTHPEECLVWLAQRADMRPYDEQGECTLQSYRKFLGQSRIYHVDDYLLDICYSTKI